MQSWEELLFLFKVDEYQYEHDMEETYRSNMSKSIKKQIEDGYFNFFILDAVHEKRKYFTEIVSFAKKKNFESYVVDLNIDVKVCVERNIHNRTEKEIKEVKNALCNIGVLLCEKTLHLQPLAR